MRKLYMFLLILIGCLSLVSAAWYFIIQGNLTATIDSLGSKKEVTLSFLPLQLNTTNSSAFANSSMQFAYNRAGNFSVGIIETIADNSAGECVEADKDCLVQYNLYDGVNYQALRDGSYVYIPNNPNKKIIIVNITCVAYSCPQTRNYIIKLNEMAII